MNRSDFPFELSRRDVLAAMPALVASAPAFAAASGPAGMSDILDMSAVSLAGALRKKDVSARELMAAHIKQVDALKPRYHAIVSRIAGDPVLKPAAAPDVAAQTEKRRG